MNKREVRKRITKNGVQIPRRCISYNKDTKTICIVNCEDGYTFDFSNCNSLTFNVGQNSSGSFHTFITGSWCKFTTNNGCKFNTDSWCIFYTGGHCSFNTGGVCSFVTWGNYNNSYKTHSNCSFILTAGDTSTFNVGQNCVYTIVNSPTKSSGVFPEYVDCCIIDGKVVETTITTKLDFTLTHNNEIIPIPPNLLRELRNNTLPFINKILNT